MAYLTGNFRDAVRALSGAGPVKQRLIQAFSSHLDEIHDDELPGEARLAFAELRTRLHQAKPMNGETPIRASVRKMSPTEAEHCAEIILDLFESTLEQEMNGRPLHLVDSENASASPIPPFLVKT